MQTETAFYYRGLASQALFNLEDAINDYSSAISSTPNTTFLQVFCFIDFLGLFIKREAIVKNRKIRRSNF